MSAPISISAHVETPSFHKGGLGRIRLSARKCQKQIPLNPPLQKGEATTPRPLGEAPLQKGEATTPQLLGEAPLQKGEVKATPSLGAAPFSNGEATAPPALGVSPFTKGEEGGRLLR